VISSSSTQGIHSSLAHLVGKVMSTSGAVCRHYNLSHCGRDEPRTAEFWAFSDHSFDIAPDGHSDNRLSTGSGNVSGCARLKDVNTVT